PAEPCPLPCPVLLSRCLDVLFRPLSFARPVVSGQWSCCLVVLFRRHARHRRGLSRPEVLSLSKTTPAAVSSGMQTITLSSNGRNGRLLDSKMSARLRAFRFLSERFAQRDRSSYAAEFFLFVLIV